jgi:hypothetical protein
MAQQLLSAGLALSSIWEKARARDRQKEVAGDKRQWGFVLQGMKPAEAQAAEWWQGTVLIMNNNPLSDELLVKIFSHFVDYLFTLVISSFTGQKL